MKDFVQSLAASPEWVQFLACLIWSAFIVITAVVLVQPLWRLARGFLGSTSGSPVLLASAAVGTLCTLPYVVAR